MSSASSSAEPAATPPGGSADGAASAAAGVGSQTLSRGIRALEVLADEPGLTIAELAARLGVHRSIAYRILRTLEEHGLVVRDAAGRVALGARLAALARGVEHDLQAAALPELTTLARELGMTAFLVVLDHRECVTLVSVEPPHSVAAVAQRPGTRHSLTAGAPGLAIGSRLGAAQLAAAGVVLPDRPELAAARERGFATSSGEVIAGLSSVAAPLLVPGSAPAAVAVVYVGEQDVVALGERLRRAADAVAAEL
ncbi:helix-turn-helix domain-containing protein [Schumannella luteola]|uniref:DNA-binding IclR family transcriptional regulator n=1 Tax=Schumannella luteola TaxID=472059 RepID=A0A852Y9Y8_9MICO|nr:helix-turn-helix domain-containing protein [Schumannella luteola]NYG99263.1 DNA-binding IclR family transcriptional regulator [Schumannella luteola]TPX05645.1 helix-turn-helix domain-containing protein [Schumannella luteola]